MRRCDTKALYVATDDRRVARGMSWAQVAVAIGVSEATTRRTREGGRMEVDGILAMVGWLDTAVEAFVREVG